MTDFLEAIRTVTDTTRAEIKDGIRDEAARKKALEEAEIEKPKLKYSTDFLKGKMMEAAHEGWARFEMTIFKDSENHNPHWWLAIAKHIEQIAKELGVRFSKTEDRHLRNSGQSSLAHCSGKISLYWGRPGQSAYGDD